jgi:hypothetical protein
MVSHYRYSTDRNNPTGAMPVYLVAAPIPSDRYPNKQNNAQGAIPVNFVAVGNANSGAVPVRIVAGTGPGPEWPSNQGDDAGAIPVFNSPAGMPVWDATGAPPLPLPIITTLSFNNPIPPSDIEILGNCAADNGPVEWSIVENRTSLDLRLNRLSGQFVIANGLIIISPSTYHITVAAANTTGFDAQDIELIFT